MENKSEIYTICFKVAQSLEFHVLWERNGDQLYLQEEMENPFIFVLSFKLIAGLVA